MPIRIPNTNVNTSLRNLGQSSQRLGFKLLERGNRQKKLEIENENAKFARIMDENLQTMSQRQLEQRNKQNNKYRVPGEQLAEGENETLYTSGDYSYALPQGSTATGEGDNIIKDYGERLWQQQFAGQFSSQDSEDNFRRVYDGKMAAYSGQFRTDNFNYRRSNEVAAIGREIAGYEANPNNLSIDNAMKPIDAAGERLVVSGLISPDDKIQNNIESRYVLLTGETWKESQAIAAGDGSGDLSPEQNIKNAKDHIYAKEGLQQTEKDSIWAKLENEHIQGTEDDKDFFVARWTGDSDLIRADIANGRIYTKNAVEDALQTISYQLPYSRDTKLFPNGELNFLKSLIDEVPKTPKEKDQDNFDSGNIESYREQMNLMLGDDQDKNTIVRMLQGGTDVFYSSGSNERANGDPAQGLSATEQNKLRAELDKQADARFALSTDAAFQAVVADGLEGLEASDKNITNSELRLYEEEATRYAATVNGASGDTGNATPAMVQEHMLAYTEAVTVKSVGELQIRNEGGKGGFLGTGIWGGIDAAEGYYQLAEQGKLSYDEGLAKKAIDNQWTAAEMRADYYNSFGDYSTLNDAQKAQVDNVETAMEVTDLTKNRFAEEFGNLPAAVVLDRGIPYTIDTDGTTYKLDFKDNNKSLDYQYLKPLRENRAEPKRKEFDLANPRKKAGRIIYGNTVDEENLEGVTNSQLYFEDLTDETWYSYRGNKWVEIPNIEDTMWTNWNEKEKQYMERVKNLNRQSNYSYSENFYDQRVR
jgi:hypothetical protein